MPLQNLIEKHVTEADKLAFKASIATIKEMVKRYTIGLTPEERQDYGSIKEENKLFANKVMDYYQSEPELSSEDVDWVEYGADYGDRSFFSASINEMIGAVTEMKNAKTLHDYDNFKNALVDYSHTKNKAEVVGGRYEAKYNELKQFFDRSSSGSSDDAETPPAV